MKTVIEVKHAAGSYPVNVGKDILENSLETLFRQFEADKIFVLMDENVARYHGNKIETLLGNYSGDSHVMNLPNGENSKTIKHWSNILDFLLTNEARRNTPLLVIGGGVTGDAGGFAAATALRGIPLIHVPTSLLAMVDSSVGGKTGINHLMGKNLIGSFYQPQQVIADIDFLQTLPRREWINGLSEILKYGAIKDVGILKESEMFFEKDPDNMDMQRLIALITRCVKVKADIVEKDEFEGGERAFLNFGHTFAHALEKACGYQEMSHGEAVYLGMLAAMQLSILAGASLQDEILKQFRPLYHFNVSKKDLTPQSLTRFMKLDKKRTGRHIRFVLLDDWQHPVVKTVKEEKLIHDAWSVVFDELD